MSQWEIKQEQTELEEQRAHDERVCDGLPFCWYCQEEWEEANREELERRGYYKC